ncbi:hypothetical protein OZL92_19760 [Bacillus sonorensis]|uniref:Protein YhfM n=3 Tax=Bacillus sonorensis TaxID=119858 RepID=M5PH50_9BACI|nr:MULTISPECIES: hypothetical protein [Bacillus]EME75992.1 protein YhfM [Bacillus sonorensis L12]MCY7855838.1 hypothetical protein [Bacillus sonorensis]MCZ0074458.1 hypothetical protein [Bacillus sonorensis]MCZ0093566.1 hypothetical protein [Bacillus sonorensis]MDR4956084.1 hypothetical protein [Bacillus sonorensis]
MMGIVLFFGILALAVFYVFSLMADPFDARNAEEITMTPAEKNGRPLRIEKKQYINGILDTFNKGKRMKENNAYDLDSPAYHGSIKMSDTDHVPFTVWLKKDGAIILKNEEKTYYHLNEREKAKFIENVQKGT